MFRTIGLVFGMLILKLVYGKKYNNKNKNTGLLFLISAAFLIWLLCIGFLVLGLAAKDFMLCLSISIGFPAIIAIWAIIVRCGIDSDNTLSEFPKEETTDTPESNTETYSMYDEDTGTWMCNVRGGYDIQSLSEEDQNESHTSNETPEEKQDQEESKQQSTYTWKCNRCFNEISSYPCEYCSENQEDNQTQPEYDLYDKIENWFKTVFGK